MKIYTKIFVTVGLIVLVVGIILAANQVIFLRKAHSTFENYYAFRGCAQLLEKTDDYATCKIGNGQIIKIVKYQNKWFLDGDLPNCWFFGLCID